MATRHENVQQFNFPSTFGGSGFPSAARGSHSMDNVGLNVFAPQAQQGFAGYNDRVDSPDRPDANNLYANGYDNGQSHMANGQHGIADPFAQFNDFGAFGDFSHQRNDFGDTFESDTTRLDDQYFVPIPDISPARSWQGNQARDLFLPQPHGYDSDDGAHRNSDGDNGQEGDDDDDDIYEKRSDHGEHDEIDSKHCL